MACVFDLNKKSGLGMLNMQSGQEKFLLLYIISAHHKKFPPIFRLIFVIVHSKIKV